ncbi:phage tail protein [Aeromonas veronii]|uniref:phage tail protein n=1 Tax=Aeromonas veronii TaxID=654 RepID=UPI001F30CCA9|nr:phage tail protein [Aeromonas veronii]
MSAIYFAIPTHAGQAKIANAIALGVPLKITQMAVGDGNGQPVTPNPAQTALVREQRRAPLNTLFQDPLNPAQLVAEQIIPENVGGWWIREVGLYDETGTLIAIANSPDTYKPQLSEGSGRTQTIRMVLIVSDTSSVELKIDPSVVLATRKYVDDVMKAHKESRDHPDASEIAKGFTRYATQAEVNETTAANQKADAVVTVKTLWGWVKQASETVLGMMKVATQQQTDTSSADDVAITPKKLRSGFASLMSPNGYIALPTWMGGLIIQWGRTPDSIANADIVVTLPTTFPRDVYSIAFAGDTFLGTVNFNRSLTELGRGSFKYSAMATGLSTKYAGYGCYYIAIGR